MCSFLYLNKNLAQKISPHEKEHLTKGSIRFMLGKCSGLHLLNSLVVYNLSHLHNRHRLQHEHIRSESAVIQIH